MGYLQDAAALEVVHYLGDRVVLVGGHPQLTLPAPPPHEQPTELAAQLGQAGLLVEGTGLCCHMLHAH